MKNTSGNALVYILLAIGLLAALSGAVMRGGGGSVDKLTDDQRKLHATDIITYATTISNAVSQLRLRSVPVAQMSFANNQSTDYGTFNTSPRFEVFHPKGGGVIYAEPPEAALYTAFTQYEFLSGNEIENVGTTCGSDECVELLLYLPDVRKDVCMWINDTVGVSNTGDEPPVDSGIDIGETFSGSFNYVSTLSGDSNELIGKKEGCFIDSSGDLYGYYYRVLLTQ